MRQAQKKKRDGKWVEFGTATLPVGETELEIIAGKPEGKNQTVSIEHILFEHSE